MTHALSLALIYSTPFFFFYSDLEDEFGWAYQMYSYPARTGQGDLESYGKNIWVLIVHKLHMSQQWDSSCFATTRARILLCI